jgi:hypothetical protein
MSILWKWLMYVRSGDTYNPDDAYKQKTIGATTKFTSKLFDTFLQRSYHRRSASAKSAAALFLVTPS